MLFYLQIWYKKEDELYMEEKFLKCFEEIAEAEKVTILTGAGISTLSGIADFRGENGFYSNGDSMYGVKKEKIFDIDFFHERPEVFFHYAKEYLYPMLDKLPSSAHLTLAKMQQKGLCGTIYTQNIDTLHTKAGTQKVTELHGTLAEHYCTLCRTPYETEFVRKIAERNEIPRCSKCHSLIKPEVVFFGEGLNEKDLTQAGNDCRQSDILLVLGSSLTVYPVAGLPGEAKVNDKKLIIVNAQKTPYDSKADFLFDDIAEFAANMQEYFHL